MMRLTRQSVKHLKVESKLMLLNILLDNLNDLDGEDTFGTEGWEHAFELENFDLSAEAEDYR